VIVVDTSALLAILLDEPEQLLFRDKLAEPTRKMISAVSVLEAGIVIAARRGDDGLAALTDLIEGAEIEVVPFDQAQARLALNAFRAYGKGLHPARLNICDCAAYALAKGMSAPLLFKGDDFAATDVAVAVR
jgi:ribonuclease VapC